MEPSQQVEAIGMNRGKHDHQVYFRSIRIEQQQLEEIVLDRLFDAWFAEAILVSGMIPVNMRSAPMTRQWFWDGIESLDPLKDAGAVRERLATNTTTLAAEYAKQGKDWQVEVRQRALEIETLKSLGIVVEPVAPQNHSDPQSSGQDNGDEGNA